MSKNENLKIAIDGPAGAGKTTAAKKIAQKTEYRYICTGSMYRALALGVLEESISPKESEIRDYLSTVDIITFDDSTYLNGRDVSSEIKEPRVTNFVSEVCGFSSVRKLMVQRQRKLAEGGGIVMEGRDIGTVVLPDADLKIYLTASAEARARRRKKELDEEGFDVSLKKVKEEISDRDDKDKSRETGPLRKAEDAITVDNTNLSIDREIKKIIKLIKKKHMEVKSI